MRHFSVGEGRDGLPQLQINELELLHHFTTETCFTLSDRQESHSLWQVTAPQEAFRHEFLMRGILAISALHLSHLRPHMSDHYAHIAAQHQDAALSCFRLVMAKMDQSNCDAFFALSSLIVVYGFESPKAADSLGMFTYNGEHSDEWLPLIRGVNSILQTVFPWIKNGRLSGLLHDHDRGPTETGIPAILDDQLKQLESFCNNVKGGEEAIIACRTAVGQLQHCFVRMNNKMPYECEVSLAFLWPVMIPEYFLSMLNQKRPEALIILAHYCVIVHHLDDYWWMRGWAMRIIENIHRELDDEWRYWLQWPTSAINVKQKILTNGELQNPISGNRVSNNFDTTVDRDLAIRSEQLKDTHPSEED